MENIKKNKLRYVFFLKKNTRLLLTFDIILIHTINLLPRV